MALHRPDDAAQSGMRPNDRGFRMALDQASHLLEITRRLTRPRKRGIHIVVEDYQQAALRAEIENAIQSGILKARNLASDLGGYELLVDGELSDSCEDSGKGPEHSLDVIDCIHIR